MRKIDIALVVVGVVEARADPIDTTSVLVEAEAWTEAYIDLAGPAGNFVYTQTVWAEAEAVDTATVVAGIAVAEMEEGAEGER